MKAKLTYTFDLPDEQCEYEDLVHSQERARKSYLILLDLDHWLRNQIKHGDATELQPARDFLYELLEQYNYSINE